MNCVVTSDSIAEGAPWSPDPRESSLRLLEFHRVREKLAGLTTFAPARELALGLVPSYETTEVAARQRETAEARRFLEEGATLDLAGVRDLRETLQRAGLGGTLTGDELRDLGETLKATRRARDGILRHKEIPALREMARDLPVLRELEKELSSSIGRAGEVLDSASSTLRELRIEAGAAHQHLVDSLERTVRRLGRHGILQEPIITERNGRAVLLLKTEMKSRLPGIVHDVSDSGATLFVEPISAIGLGNHWRELRLAQEREEERVLRSLSAYAGARGDEILRGLELLARLDMAMAKARYSLVIKGTTPAVVEAEHPYVRLVDARHPLLEGEVVPITVKLGDGVSLLLITGPNAGGKTVALKTVGLLDLMAQSGLHIPASEGTLSLFDGVYADIGDQQSIERSLSTFSSHVQNLRGIMEWSTGRSLVLIDELGTSTDPEEGAALAKAVLGYFAGRGTALVATTHQREVAAFVQEQPEMMNASVELDSRSLAPTYRLTLGLPGRSYALTIAAQMGLDRGVIEGARSLLSPGHQTTEDLLSELQEERDLAGKVRREADGALVEAEGRRAELDARLAAIQDSEAQMLEEARHEIQKGVQELTARLRRAERQLQQPEAGTAIPETIKVARSEVAEVRQELSSPDWQPPPSRRGDWLKRLRPGDRVYLRGIPRPVEVITAPGDDEVVEVLLGTIRARLPVHQLDRAAPANTVPTGDGIYYSRSAKRDIKAELDLRGARVEEALERLEGYLSDAAVAGLSSVGILHGTGTGALRSAVREHLSHHPLATPVGSDEGLSTDSVTVVRLV